MRLEIGRVDHDSPTFGLGAGQPLHHPDEDASLTPSLPAVVEGLRRAVFPWRIAPPQPVAIDEDYSAQDPSVIDARLRTLVYERQSMLAEMYRGRYIPPATRNVFLKYYTDADAQQVHFWSIQDREAYLGALLTAVEPYLRPEADDG